MPTRPAIKNSIDEVDGFKGESPSINIGMPTKPKTKNKILKADDFMSESLSQNQYL